jgi:hypothetical protein
MRSSGTRARLQLAVTGALCVLLLGACSKLGGNSTTSTATPGSGASAGSGAATTAVSNACTLLTKAQVAQATGNSIDFTKQANAGPVSTCTYGSLSGFAVILSVTSSSAASLSSDIPGLGNVVTKYHLTPVSGVGDQAYAGSNAIIARKGNNVFTIVYAAFSGGNHQQALEKMATDVASGL